MSFLSTLFCCFDAEDSAVKENNVTTTHPKLTKTQSNLQRALTHSKPNSNSTLDLNSGNSTTPVPHASNGAGDLSKNLTNSSNKPGQANKSTNRKSLGNSSANINTGSNSADPKKTTPATGSNNTDSNNTSKNKKQNSANKSSSINKQNSATAANNISNGNSQYSDRKMDSSNSNNNNNSKIKDSDNMNKSSQKMSYSDSNSTTHHNSNDYKEIVEEITDLKDSTDSSKDEDDACQIHEHQTQNTDETDVNNQPETKNKSSTEAISENKSTGDNTSPSGNNSNNFNNDSNPISNLNPDSVVNTLDYEEQLYDEQFGTNLTEILPDQVVSSSGWLLDAQPKQLKGRKCLVLDLDETLVHSSFKYVRQCDFVIPVEIEDQIHNVYVIKRPGVDQFLKRVGELYEVVVFTASVSRYGDPLLDILDTHKSVHHRLFRESCYNYQGNYIKNLSQMGRPLEDLIIIDNSPASYVFHPQHAVPISSWFSDSHDCELTDLLPFLEDLANKEVDDIRLVLDINI